MKNKNGFTLVEVSVSIALLAVVLIFIINFLTIIKSSEDEVSLDTKLMINSSLISKAINRDILSEDGIASCTCTLINCDITLASGVSRRLYLSNDGLTIYYYDVTNGEMLFTRASIESYPYSLEYEAKSTIHQININVSNSPENDIQIVSKK